MLFSRRLAWTQKLQLLQLHLKSHQHDRRERSGTNIRYSIIPHHDPEPSELFLQAHNRQLYMVRTILQLHTSSLTARASEGRHHSSSHCLTQKDHHRAARLRVEYKLEIWPTQYSMLGPTGAWLIGVGVVEVVQKAWRVRNVVS